MRLLKSVKVPGKNSFCALDVGSHKLTVAFAVIGGQEGLGNILIESSPAKGIFKGVVNDLALFSETIRRALGKMETRCGQKIPRVSVSINGNYIQARHSVAAVALAEHGMRCITKRDVGRLNQQTKTLGLELDEYLLHQYPQGYSIDRHNMTLNPVGLHGRKLEEDLLLVTAAASHVENIVRAVEQAGCDVENCVYAGIAAAHAVLTPEEREKGVVLVDIGETLTGVLVYKEDVARHMSILSFGGRNISEIVSQFCGLSLEAADELKRNSLELTSEEAGSEEVLVRSDNVYRSVKKAELAGVIAPEIEKFLETLKSRIAESGLERVLSYKVVVVGGLSLQEGLLEKMERALGMPVRLGLPRSLNQTSLSQAPLYASAVGLLEMQLEDHRRRSFPSQAQDKAPWRKLGDYLADLYHDYF
ncbi:MAG: cell division protein FtsA [Candidatus Omnitrophota bacterium]